MPAQYPCRIKSRRYKVCVWLSAALLCAALGCRAEVGDQPWALDAGTDAGNAVAVLEQCGLTRPPAGSYLRIRNLAVAPTHELDRPESNATALQIRSERESLRALRSMGYRVIALLQWPPGAWMSGSRSQSLRRGLPLDLREGFTRCRRLCSTYGDLVDWWEIENEPDIAFVDENPETYSAFLKSCYWGITSGHPMRGAVLGGAFGLPPGHYLDRFSANQGFRYTSGFNFHYYGYAEDFSGVYHQFEAAVAHRPHTSSDIHPETLFSTQFYPDTSNWLRVDSRLFHFQPTDSATNLARLQHRPLASEEPREHLQGRWLVTDGVSVEEQGGRWQFIISRFPPGPLRSPCAELPLPSGWSAGPSTFIAFAYRIARTQAPKQPVSTPAPVTFAKLADPTGMFHPESLPPKGDSIALPVFISEYGYAEMALADAQRPGERRRQADWFRSVSDQIEALGVQAACAFDLVPYSERGLVEFGLTSVDQPNTCTLKATPALRELTRYASLCRHPQTWWTNGRPPTSPVVIDFVAGPGLVPARTYGGYIMAPGSSTATGSIVLYNFGSAPSSGTLRLSGEDWRFASGCRALAVRLAPFARTALPLLIAAPQRTFLASECTACYSAEAHNPNQDTVALTESDTGHAKKASAGSSAVDSEAQGMDFDCDLRTANGNLYGIWPRNYATAHTGMFLEPLANFTLMFYGRACLPYEFSENQPSALVFMFHPLSFPVSIEITIPKSIEFISPAPANNLQRLTAAPSAR